MNFIDDLEKQKKDRNHDFQKAFWDAFWFTYPYDDYDVHQDDKSQKFKKNKNNAFYIITSLLGLPNRDLGETSYFKTLWRNFTGFPANTASTSRKVVGGLLAPFFIVYNTLKFVTSLPINIAKCFTEFLPLLAANYLKIKSEQFKHEPFIRNALLTGHIFFRAWHFVGMAVTSSIKGVRAAWRLQHELVDRKDDLMAHLVGGLFVALSMTITIISYAFILPAIMQVAAAKLPVAAVKAIQYVDSKIEPGLHDTFGMIGNSIVHRLHGFSPIAAGFAVVVSGVVTSIGSTLSRKLGRLKAWWYKDLPEDLTPSPQLDSSGSRQIAVRKLSSSDLKYADRMHAEGSPSSTKYLLKSNSADLEKAEAQRQAEEQRKLQEAKEERLRSLKRTPPLPIFSSPYVPTPNSSPVSAIARLFSTSSATPTWAKPIIGAVPSSPASSPP